MRRTTLVLAALVLLAVVGATTSAQAALPIGTPGCGDSVGSSIRLGADVGSQANPCAGDGLVITSSNVTLHLNGHTIWGNGDGVDDVGVGSSDRSAVVVKRGTIRGFFRGISMDGGLGHRFSGLTLANNSIGIDMTGDDLGATGNVVTGSAIAGIAFGGPNSGGRGIISGNTITASGLVGVQLQDVTRVTVANNTITNSGFAGIAGELCGCISTISGNTISTSVAEQGIIIEGKTTVSANSVTKSGTNGIEVLGAPNTVSTVAGNSTSANGTASDADGIHIVPDGTIVNGNRSWGNTSDGIEIEGNNAVVSRNKTFDNTNDGIAIPGDNPKLTGNRVSGNGVDGVGVIGNNARFSGNNSSGNGDDGFHVIGTGERFIENVAKGNGYPASPGVGLGINAPGGTGRDNIAQGNDDPTQCNTNANVC